MARYQRLHTEGNRTVNNRETQLQAIVVRILGIGKRTAPDRFPRFETAPGELDYELIRDWAEVIRVVRYPLTPEEELSLWEEATRLWVREAEHSRMVTAGEILRAAKRVWGKWNERPNLKALFDGRRESLIEQRDRAIASGDFGRGLGYRPRPVERKPALPDYVEALVERKSLERN